MHSIQKQLIELTKPPSLYRRAEYLIDETFRVVEKVALLMSLKTWFNPEYFPWIEHMSIEELGREIEELSASMIIPTVMAMNTPLVNPRDLLEEEIQRREMQLDALEILFCKPWITELKYYMMEVRAKKLKEKTQ